MPHRGHEWVRQPEVTHGHDELKSAAGGVTWTGGTDRLPRASKPGRSAGSGGRTRTYDTQIMIAILTSPLVQMMAF